MRTRALIGVIFAAVVLSTSGSRAADAPHLTLAAVSPADVGSVDRMVSQMVRGGELRLRESTPDSLMPGRTHERLDQYYRGVRVFGGDLVRQVTSGGAAVSVFGQMYQDIDLDT